MKDNIDQIFDESIKLEINVSDLYLVFYNMFPVDAKFWWSLVLEEKHHAALLQSGKEHFEPVHQFPHDILDSNLNELKEANSKIEDIFKECKNNPPSRLEAFNIALEIENGAGEVHFQEFMSKDKSSYLNEIFKELNKDDKEHASRISSYMKNNGVLV